jgi:ribosome biogenesis GTPase
MPFDTATLNDLGWNDAFQAHVAEDEMATCLPVRVMSVHRGQIAVAGLGVDANEQQMISPYIRGADEADAHPTVGDWLLVWRASGEVKRVLPRNNLFKRRAAGNGRGEQMIAANVDTLFIVASCNLDFNVGRIERYLVLAREVNVAPVIILTKIDLAERVEDYVSAVLGIDKNLTVEPINGRDTDSVARLAKYCGHGQTVALLGSSGVGKSTLVNSLRGSQSIATQAVREGDHSGRHTTTHRELHRLEQGGWLMDTPGMRELHLADAADGMAEVFDDIQDIASECRFSNCAHKTEPGCMIREALASGAVTQDRYERWQKLVAAEAAANVKIYPKRR